MFTESHRVVNNLINPKLTTSEEKFIIFHSLGDTGVCVPSITSQTLLKRT